MLSSPQIRTGSNSPAGKSCRRVPEVYWPVPLESCQEGRQQREGQRRNAAGDLSRACLSRCLDSHGAEPYNYNHRQLSATCLYPHSPAVPITTAAAAEVRVEKSCPSNPRQTNSVFQHTHHSLLFIDCFFLRCKSKSSSDDFPALTFVQEEDRKLKIEN